MRITKCFEKNIEETHFVLKWAEDEIPNIQGCECIDIGMKNAIAFPKEYLQRILEQNPGCKIAGLIENEAERIIEKGG